MKDLRGTIKEFNLAYSNYIEANRIHDEMFGKIQKIAEAEFNKAWSARFPIKPHGSFSSAGSKAKGYVPEISLFWLYYRPCWVRINSNNEFTEIADQKEMGFSVQDVFDFAKEFEKETGLPVNIHIEKVKTKEDIERIRTQEDLEIYYEDRQVKIVDDGEFWYVGWDISDPFFLITLDGKKEIHVLYSSNGHGFGIDHTIEPGNKEGLDEFIQYAEDNDPSFGSLKSTILESWE